MTSPSASRTSSSSRPHTPHTRLTCHTAPNSSRCIVLAGFTTTFLKLYSRQCEQCFERAMRSARSREIARGTNATDPYLVELPAGLLVSRRGIRR